jgi:catechol 2,3-dioxygenase
LPAPQNKGNPLQYAIPTSTKPGHVHYTVADLARQISFYRDILGFRLHWQHEDSAGLGAGGEDLLLLTQVCGARQVRGMTGLYHTAFLVPTQMELAQLLRRIAETHTPIEGMSNHGTHHATYLPDAEGNGVEDALAALVERVWAAGMKVDEREDGFLLRDPAENGLLLKVGIEKFDI